MRYQKEIPNLFGLGINAFIHLFNFGRWLRPLRLFKSRIYRIKIKIIKNNL